MHVFGTITEYPYCEILCKLYIDLNRHKQNTFFICLICFYIMNHTLKILSTRTNIF